MKEEIQTGLLISTYNWPEALNLVLQSILQQTVMPHEIIIADDGSSNTTKELIDSFRDKFTIPVKHFWQQDDGFRKSAIINRALANTSCNYIIQIDGDIIMNPHFIEDHIRVSEKGFYIRGSRVLLKTDKSNKMLDSGKLVKLWPFSSGIKNRVNAFRVPLFSFLFIKKSWRSDNLHGSNCAYWKSDFVKVNGYNNQLKGWGHEDIELAARFINSGMGQKKIKMLGICYHLHHKYNDRKRAEINFGIYLESVKNGAITCADGYQQIIQND